MKASDEPAGPHDPDRRVARTLLAACPSIAAKWAEHLAEWAPDQPPVYIDAMMFSGHLVDLVEAGETTELPAVFEAIERLLRDDDRGVQYLVTFGLLEGIGNIAANRHDWTFAGRFRGWMGPQTEAAWDEVHRLWGTGRHDPRLT